MSIAPGNYFIQSGANSNQFVGIGALPPSPSPLRLTADSLKALVEVEEQGDNEYTLKTDNFMIGVDENNRVAMVPLGETPIQWVIQQAKNPDFFNLRLASEDKFWTASNDLLSPIGVEGADQGPHQDWKFVVSV